MLAHVSIGVRDVARAMKFYDAALAPLGYSRVYNGDGYAGYGAQSPQFWLNTSPSPVPEDAKSGLHFCFTAPTRASVDSFHAAALQAGAKDNGQPGLRPHYGPKYYAAFVVDPDGYRIEAWCNTE